MDFNANEPLNIARYKHKTEGEKLYDKEVETQKRKDFRFATAYQ